MKTISGISITDATINMYFQSITGDTIANNNSILEVNGNSIVNLIGGLMGTTAASDITAIIINLMGGNINLNINQITSSGTCINLPTGSTANLNAYVGELQIILLELVPLVLHYLPRGWYIIHSLQYYEMLIMV